MITCRCFFCDELVAFDAALIDLTTGKIKCHPCNELDAEAAR